VGNTWKYPLDPSGVIKRDSGKSSMSIHGIVTKKFMFDDIYRGFSNLIEDFFGGFISNGSSWNSMGDFPLPCFMTSEIRSYRKSWTRG